MSEISFVFRSHPLLISILALGLSPVLVSALVIFSPILVTLLLFLLAIAGLARSTRRSKSRRRRKHHLQESLLRGADEEELLRGEKQTRVNEYLEDQLRHLGDFPPLEESLLYGLPDESSPGASSPGRYFSDFRSDISDFGDKSAEGLIPGEWENEDEDGE